ncbi:MAG TPA: MBL fold metallo-hydrolase [Thermoanaerobaculia bacterium]|nr:MBL fold metallo-hydrolase [Thermoanaerobaculia bacterium]
MVKRIAIGAGIAGGAVAIERYVIAAPHYHGPISDHFDGERFRNADPSWQSERSFLKWQFEREPGFWPEWIEGEAGPAPLPRVGDGRMRVTWVNHATLLLQVENLNILTDPMWSERCSPVSFLGPRRHRAPGLRFRDLPPIDVVLVSHNHYDHLDVATLHRLRWKFAPLIITPLGNTLLMSRVGIRAAKELDWWEAVRVNEHVEITCVPSQHFCARGLSDRNRALWGGFVIATRSGNAYFAGDTGWGSHFERIRDRFRSIRLAMLPIGAYLPRWFMRPAHIDPAEAVEAHKVLGADVSVPMHYGTFRLSDEGEAQPADDLRRAIAANGVSSFEIIRHGEGFEA